MLTLPWEEHRTLESPLGKRVTMSQAQSLSLNNLLSQLYKMDFHKCRDEGLEDCLHRLGEASRKLAVLQGCTARLSTWTPLMTESKDTGSYSPLGFLSLFFKGL
jgi:hypothetical protein